MRITALLLTWLTLAAAGDAAGQGVAQHSVSSPADAGKNIPAGGPMTCDYNTCALRTKISWGTLLILRGEDETRVEKLVMFRTAKVQSLVATSPEAATEARAFERNYLPGQISQFIGAFLLVFSAATAGGDGSAVVPISGVVVGSASLFYGVFRSVRATNSLHKTIWLYNRSLQR
jgi:hypothetical protein